MVLVQLLVFLLCLFYPLLRLLLLNNVLNLDVSLQLVNTLHLLLQVLIHYQRSHLLRKLLWSVCLEVSFFKNILVFFLKDFNLLGQTKLTEIGLQLILHLDHFVGDPLLVSHIP